MTRRKVAVAVAVLATGLTIAGCGGGGSNDGAMRAWATKVCHTFAANANAPLQLPQQDSNPVRYKVNVAAFLGDLATRLQQQAQSLKAAGSPPAHGGDAAYKTAILKIEQAHASTITAETQLNRSTATDKATIQRQIASLSTIFRSSASYQTPKQVMSQASPDLAKALSGAASCKNVT